MNFVHLIKLIGARKQRCERQNLKKDATNPPVVHLVIVVTVSQQALRRPVPSCRNVLCERWLRINSSARTEVGKFDHVARDQDVLRLDVPVVDAVSVHMVNGLKHLVHHVLDTGLGQRRPLSLDGLIHVHLHELKNQSQPSCRFIVQHLK